MTSPCDVTVVVPAYCAEPYLRATLDNVAAQTLPPVELIVVDDGSPDGTRAVVERFAREHPHLPVRLLAEPHRGPGATRNAGVRAAKTPWIAFLDSDDLWRPEKLARVWQAVLAHPAANFFCHNEITRQVDGTEQPADYGAGYDAGRSLPAQLYRRNYFSTSAVVCRRESVLQCGGFDETLSSAQDYELWLRMSPELRPVFVRESLGVYVMRPGNISTSRAWRRLLNMWRVRYRHRSKGGPVQFVWRICRESLSSLAGPIRQWWRR